MKARAVVFVVAAAAAGYFGYTTWAAQQSSLPPNIAFGNGQIEAVQVDVAARTGGRVAEVMVREGDLVETGQVLVTMDTAQLEAQYARAEADIARAESDVAAATATIAQSEARLIFAEQALDRTRELVERGVGTREQLDASISEHLVAEANLAAAVANEIAQMRRVDAAEAQLREISTQLDDSELVSTVTGRVLYRLAEPGEVIGTGGKVLTIVDLSDVYMEFFLPSTEAHRVALGSEARVVLDIFDFAAPATVSYVSPQSQFSPRSVEIRDEREKLMFRTRVRIPQELVQTNIDAVMTGIRGVAYVRLQPDDGGPWPEELQLPQPILDALQAAGEGS